jgi:regulator of protease activity HflC (stomatin/prohibitin superfamily)
MHLGIVITGGQGSSGSLGWQALAGEARQMTESAEAYRSSKVNESVGDAARFSAVAAEYAKAPEVTSERLYIEALEQILPKIRKLIVDPNGNVDLSIIRKGGDAPISSQTGR